MGQAETSLLYLVRLKLLQLAGQSTTRGLICLLSLFASFS